MIKFVKNGYVLTTGAVLLYISIFLIFFRSVGGEIAVMAIFPVLAGGGAFGVTGAIIANILIIPLNYFLFNLVGAEAFRLTKISAFSSAFTLLPASLLIGRVRDLLNQVRAQNVELTSSKEKLAQQNVLLEKEVARRTQELEKAKLNLEKQLAKESSFSRIIVEREGKMMELKKEIEELKRKSGSTTPTP